jgi:hypothetical protein
MARSAAVVGAGVGGLSAAVGPDLDAVAVPYLGAELRDPAGRRLTPLPLARIRRRTGRDVRAMPCCARRRHSRLSRARQVGTSAARRLRRCAAIRTGASAVP